MNGFSAQGQAVAAIELPKDALTLIGSAFTLRERAGRRSRVFGGT